MINDTSFSKWPAMLHSSRAGGLRGAPTNDGYIGFHDGGLPQTGATSSTVPPQRDSDDITPCIVCGNPKPVRYLCREQASLDGIGWRIVCEKCMARTNKRYDTSEDAVQAWNAGKVSPPPRGAILDKAKAIINGERQDQYGAPEDSFALIAQFWSAYLGVEVTPRQVALMMALFKMARERHQHKEDNVIDAAGYLGIAGDMK